MIPQLNGFKTGPVKVQTDQKRLGSSKMDSDGVTPKIRSKAKSANQRPASPSVIKTNSIFNIARIIIALEATYNIYVGSKKAGQSTKQRYRIRSANAEKGGDIRRLASGGKSQ